MSAALSQLAAGLADAARAAGLAVVAIEASRLVASNSRYLHLRDAAGRPWCIRVSDHERAMTPDRPRPQYNLILRPADLAQARAAACRWIERVAAGQVEWTDPAPTRPRAHR